MSFVKKNYQGILLSFFIALIATFLGQRFSIIGGPVFGILLGLIIALFPRKQMFEPGIAFTSKKILQYAIVLLGFSMNLFQIFAVGSQSLLIIITTIATALIVSYFISKWLKVPTDVSILVGVGSSICGGSAIAATAPVIKAKGEDIATSISVIFLFNVLAAFLFPIFGNILGMNDIGFGMWAGTAINDTSSVVAAGQTWAVSHASDVALNYATIVKLTRTLAIIPIT
ncbi:MAG: putative sulfate exporter family transporter, partial [Tetragenococcus halophilus]|nr:putative sulfate exporter family transporter [Tetragenococcus halophilus]MDN6163870.1 putative sulfate exporter family transporter [Tetragenococcus halophilus]MDN6526916.1 putative sulfate exporter family transporter [Tetragenococcus halophilus]